VADPTDAQSLESFDAADDVYQRIERAYLVQGDLVGRKPVYGPLGLAQEAEGSNGALPDPVGEWGLLDQPHQVGDVPMWRVPVGLARSRMVWGMRVTRIIVGMPVRVVMLAMPGVTVGALMFVHRGIVGTLH
jgi:hypothetical protein